MSDIGSAPPWITTVVTSFFSALGGTAVTAWWARGLLASMDEKHEQKVQTAKKEIKDEHDRLFREAKEEHIRLSREVKEEADTLAHSFGEGLSAIRQKVHEVETWNRDNFVRREDFFEAMKTIHRSLENLSSELKMSMTEVRSKMERLLVGGGK